MHTLKLKNVLMKNLNNRIFFLLFSCVKISYLNSAEFFCRRYLQKETYTMNTITLGWKKQKFHEAEVASKNKVSQNHSSSKVRLFALNNTLLFE
jgi:hypothetical protein